MNRRDVLKAAAALPLMAGATKSVAQEAVATAERVIVTGVGGGTIQASRGVVESYQEPAIDGLWRLARDKFQRRLTARFRDRLPYAHEYEIAPGFSGCEVFRVCFLCCEMDFWENVPYRGHPFWCCICVDCFPDAEGILRRMIE